MKAPKSPSRRHPRFPSNNQHDSTPCSPDDNEAIARGGVTTPFPWKLHEMLDDSEKDGNEWIVSWQSHGRSFLVHQPKVFVKRIMPAYFNQSKFASFQRQLNLYGFNRLTHGPDKGAYYHKCFVRGQSHLCRKMTRIKVKGTKVRRSLGPNEEPNFYESPVASANQYDSASSASHPPPPDNSYDPLLAQPCRNHEMSSCPSRSMPRRVSGKFNDRLFDGKTLSSVCDAMRQASKAIQLGESSVCTKVQEPILPSVSPMDSEVSDSEESGSASPSHQKSCKSQIMRVALMSKLSVKDKKGTGQSRMQDLLTPHIKGGDLLFFEGKPFHYLEHLDSLPPHPSDGRKQKEQLSQRALSQYNRQTDSLHSLVRGDPHSFMNATF